MLPDAPGPPLAMPLIQLLQNTDASFIRTQNKPCNRVRRTLEADSSNHYGVRSNPGLRTTELEQAANRLIIWHATSRRWAISKQPVSYEYRDQRLEASSCLPLCCHSGADSERNSDSRIARTLPLEQCPVCVVEICCAAESKAARPASLCATNFNNSLAFGWCSAGEWPARNISSDFDRRRNDAC